MGECIFCNGAPGNERVTANAAWLAVRDSYPVLPGHMLLIPATHRVRLFDVNQREWMMLWDIIARSDLAVSNADGWTFGINDGESAGRTVHHLHIHMIPRRSGDVGDPRGGIRNAFPGAARPWENAS